MYTINYFFVGEEQSVTSKRNLNKLWQQKVANKQGHTNVNLLDIGANMHTLNGPAEQFYADQKGSREGRISQEIDSEYEEEREKIQMNEIINKERQQLEEDVIRTRS